ncbi:RAD18 [Candida theae]|uniref:Postreplication repair E3 ubiquitin-protein ligase RAD18 n=1 Tax=Candida theae TaxID=1198502 RepID=A0AAD5BHT5_9ASCO|nr:RAD18 [Candida theae]KAI5964471.1 RAD18 [Candida theae]
MKDITDPSDFKHTAIPNLAELDVLERCYICKEFFRAPVITGCHHTFCSQCIREYLITNNLCPLCKTEVYESTLKRDVLLEEIVECYKKIRPLLLKNLDEKDQQKKRQREVSVEISDSDSEVEVVDAKKAKTSTEVPDIKPPSASKEESAPDLVECPICSRKMDAERLQTVHIDACLSGKDEPPPVRNGNGRSSISSFFTPVKSASPTPTPSITKSHPAQQRQPSEELKPAPKRLQKLDFASLSTPKLKAKMAALKLSTFGTRHQLELRYNKFFVLHNSNCDSQYPVPQHALRQQLKQWEVSNPVFTNNGSLRYNDDILDSNFSSTEWLKKYDAEFKELVKQAKGNAS